MGENKKNIYEKKTAYPTSWCPPQKKKDTDTAASTVTAQQAGKRNEVCVSQGSRRGRPVEMLVLYSKQTPVTYKFLRGAVNKKKQHKSYSRFLIWEENTAAGCD